jgi:hypothetical protein
VSWRWKTAARRRLIAHSRRACRDQDVAQLVADRRFAHRKREPGGGACSGLSTMKNKLVRLLFADPDERRGLLELLTQSLSSAVEAVRPNRSFPRRNPGKLKPGFHPAYKRTA